MSKFFAVENLTVRSLKSCTPWDFTPTEKITESIRHDKTTRQQWYSTADTKHQFYCAIEPVNANVRPDRDANQPLFTHGFVADFDLKIPEERVTEAIKGMDNKPAFVERSLSGNVRLVWTLEKPLLVSGYDFSKFVQQHAIQWLRLGLLPGLDEPAFTEPTRLYCNGCDWKATGAGPIPQEHAQAFLVKVASEYNFKGSPSECQIPYNVVEEGLKIKYPAFSWPEAFDLKSRGPTFWIPESTSPLSATVWPGGMSTFAAHASKNFYGWSELLGEDFVKNFTISSIALATEDIWWDHHNFWRKKQGHYLAVSDAEMDDYLQVTCKLSSKPDNSGVSPFKQARCYVRENQCVHKVGPFTFAKPGLLMYQGERYLNTYNCKPMEPAAGTQKWGPHGSFPIISRFLQESLFDLSESDQFTPFIAWLQRYYESAYLWIPRLGHVVFMFGQPHWGKTFLSRQIVAPMVGGFIDASDYFLGGSFNGHIWDKPHLCMDDDSPMNSPGQVVKMQALVKKMAANREFTRNEKFQKQGQVNWTGRIFCTANMDFVSSRAFSGADASLMCRTAVFRCNSKTPLKFTPELVIEMQKELPYFCRAVLDFKVPNEIEREERYGYMAFHEKKMMEQLHQSSYVAPFKEVLIECLYAYFKDNPQAPHWSGSSTQLLKMIHGSSASVTIAHSLKSEQCNRYLEAIEREGLFKCAVSTGPMNVRIWTFTRDSAPDCSGIGTQINHNVDFRSDK